MRLLLVSYFYLFDESTGALRPRAMAKYLPRWGVDVSVLTYRCQREIMSIHSDVIGVKNVTREAGSLYFYYVWRIWQNGLRLIGKYRDPYIYWKENVLKNTDEIMAYAKPDAVLASYPTVAAMEIGVNLAERYQIPLISDFRDGLLFEPLEESALRYAATRHHYEALEERVVAASKLILTVSGPISTYFRQRYAHPNVLTLHNGFDLDDISPDMSVELPEDTVNIVHTGRIGASRAGSEQGVRALCEALCMLLDRLSSSCRIQLHFVGQLSSQEKNSLAPLVRRGVVKIWGPQSRAKALGFQHKANILMLITAPDKASIATGKLFEYLAVEKPILALTRGTEAERIVVETGAGVVASPDRPSEIADAIERLVSPKKMRLTRNEALISTFTRAEQMRLLAERVKDIR